MADHEASKINHDNHLLLDQPLLRLPCELLKKNFRAAHFTFEKDSTFVKNLLKETATASINGKTSPQDVVKNLDTMLTRMRGMKRKLESYSEEESSIYRQVDARVAHLKELSTMHTVEDIRYEAWSRQRLDRLVVDYMLRHGYNESAISLANERQMQDLVDIDTFVAMDKIRRSLENGSVTEALAWCSENKKALRNMGSNLEFMLRCQQFIEMMRMGKQLEAISHAKKHFVQFRDSYQQEVHQLAGLLAHRPDTELEPYKTWYSQERWNRIADIFVEAHNKLLVLPSFPLLHIALSSGLSALKTPACHSSQATSSSQPSHSTSLTTNVCPICSTELNELARNVPYAHHSKSHVEHDLLLLPNGRVYGKARLEEYAAKAGLQPGHCKDLVTGQMYTFDQLKKVFIT
ncbi:CTLH/CRA C-terminal to LisH motif domain containing protein [Rhypophila decipiens]